MDEVGLAIMLGGGAIGLIVVLAAIMMLNR